MAPLAVLVMLPPTVCVMPHGVVNKDIAWSGVKVADLINSSVLITRHETDIANPTSVLTPPQIYGASKERSFKKSSQKSTLSSITLLMNAEVVDNGLVQHLGHDGTLSHGKVGLDLQLMGYWKAARWSGCGWRQNRHRRETS